MEGFKKGDDETAEEYSARPDPQEEGLIVLSGIDARGEDFLILLSTEGARIVIRELQYSINKYVGLDDAMLGGTDQ